MPTCHVVAGPNGAGKTTLANAWLREELEIREFLNADLMAEELARSPNPPRSVEFAAGRQFLARLDELVANGSDLLLETTLSGLSYLQRFREMKEAGYRIHLIFLRLPSVDMAIARVANRVRQGSHDIPEPVIRRRFNAGRDDFARHYRDTVDAWRLCDSSVLSVHILGEGIEVDNSATTDGTFARALGGVAARAVGTARETRKPVIVWNNGKVVRLTPGEIHQYRDATR